MQRGFSLVELSIVLVILGLLTGGILAGQSLIRASELRAITTEYQHYVTAAHSFRDKYSMLPGDFTRATDLWGSLGGTGSDATCQNLSATGTRATCNGDGGGTLASTSGVSIAEYYRFWQHLANAGLIEGQYTGVWGGAYTLRQNVPGSRINNGMWQAGYIAGTFAGGTTTFAGNYGHYYFPVVSGYSLASTGSLGFKPEEAWNIDTKLDDGVPGTGRILAVKGNGTNTNCTTFAGVAPPGDAGATYLLTNTNKDCAQFFTRAF